MSTNTTCGRVVLENEPTAWPHPRRHLHSVCGPQSPLHQLPGCCRLQPHHQSTQSHCRPLAAAPSWTRRPGRLGDEAASRNRKNGSNSSTSAPATAGAPRPKEGASSERARASRVGELITVAATAAENEHPGSPRSSRFSLSLLYCNTHHDILPWLSPVLSPRPYEALGLSPQPSAS